MAREEISLLEALREDLSVHSVKDGCSPQGQCGCCTVLVDGSPRVSCVTPLRRVAGRSVSTVDDLPARSVGGPRALSGADRLVESFVAHGASQCGFCTPGILCRLAGLPADPTADQVESALLAHLCRCTGWRSIVAAVADTGAVADVVGVDVAGGDVAGGAVLDGDAADVAIVATAVRPSAVGSVSVSPGAAARASLEGGVPQAVGTGVVRGGGRFADDEAPSDCLVAVPIAGGDQSSATGWSVAGTLAEARTGAGKIQGRRSGGEMSYPVDIPAGQWDITLQTTWVEPGYLEPDASWCRPGGTPASPYGNGGAFGGKIDSLAPAAARMLADHHGTAVKVLYSREDVVRLGPKRPPIGAGVRLDGSGRLHLGWSGSAPGRPAPSGDSGAWPSAGGAAAPVTAGDSRQKAGWDTGFCPEIAVETVAVSGPPTSMAIRGAVWAEVAVLEAAAEATCKGHLSATVTTADGARAEARVTVDAGGWPTGVEIEVDAGDPLDEVVLSSYVQGAAHMALGWVCSEGIAVGDDGNPVDLTIRSFGILRAKDTPPISVTIAPGAGRAAVPVADASFAAVAAATWLAQGLPSRWPSRRGTRR
ncbi:MAG TPA: 2Fe-2S iron-sulfur cluster-binding protein [Acidimicrobiales bacterium]|nr:2Fe-2S iron-sulfur cluster-binding protein [Acidimicrobiales bacterium]